MQVFGDVFAADIVLGSRGTVSERVGRYLEGTDGIVGYHATVYAGTRPGTTKDGAGLEDDESVSGVDGEVCLCSNEAEPAYGDVRIDCIVEIEAEALPAPTTITFGMV